MPHHNKFWMNETMEKLPGHEKLYKFICFITGRRKKKFTYKDWYIVLRILNQDEEEGQRFAMYQVLNIYFRNNKTLPKNVKDK